MAMNVASTNGTHPAKTIRVFVLDDHAVVRQGVRSVLTNDEGFEIVGEAGTFTEGLRGIVATRPDVAIVDMRLPGGDGVQVIREVRSRNQATRCVVLTSFPEEDAFFQAVVAGAAGYVSKDIPNDELVAAIRAVAVGRSVLKWEQVSALRDHAQTLPPEDDFLSTLTGQERRILELVAEGLTNREIAERVFLAEKTVRNYVSNVLAKLGMKNRTQVAAYVARCAYERGNGTVHRAR
ncbi:MAG: response regulator [Nitriliruptorales bacterium]